MYLPRLPSARATTLVILFITYRDIFAQFSVPAARRGAQISSFRQNYQQNTFVFFIANTAIKINLQLLPVPLFYQFQDARLIQVHPQLDSSTCALLIFCREVSNHRPSHNLYT